MELEPKQIDGSQDPEKPKFVHLPALISDEFGTSTSQARMEIMLGSVEVDGEPWEGDKLDLPYDEVVGKTISVLGETRQFRITYKG